MANYYVYSGAAGTGTGADWANAYTTMTLAVAGKAAGDVYYVAHDHSESTAAAVTIAFVGTEASPNEVYCVDRAGSVPPVAADLRTTGIVATTGASTIALTGTFKINGLIFNAGSAASVASITIGSTANRSSRLSNCQLNIANTAATSRINLGGSGALCILDNVTMTFGSTSQGVTTLGRGFWRNTLSALVGATIPTALFIPGATTGRWLIEGVDLGALVGGKFLVTPAAGISLACNLIFKDCKLGGATILNGAFGASMGGLEVTIIRTDSGDTNHRIEHHNYSGSQTTETTIVRTGGASDGTTPVSWKFVTTANVEWGWPFESLPISFWNEIVGSPITVTLQGTWGGGAVPLNDEIWVDINYLGTSGFPLAVKATCGKASELTTGANLPAGSGVWGGGTTQFALAATFTPQEKGPVTCYIKVAKISSTFYVDPKPTIT